MTRGGLILIVTVDGVVHAIDNQTGDEMWSIDTGGPLLTCEASEESKKALLLMEPPIFDVGPSQRLFYPNNNKDVLSNQVVLQDLPNSPMRVGEEYTMFTSNVHTMVQVNALDGEVESSDLFDPTLSNINAMVSPSEENTKSSIRVLRTTTSISLVGLNRCLWRSKVGHVNITTVLKSKMDLGEVSSTNSNYHLSKNASKIRVFTNGDVKGNQWSLSLPTDIVQASIFVEGEGFQQVDLEEDLSNYVSEGILESMSLNCVKENCSVHSFNGIPFLIGHAKKNQNAAEVMFPPKRNSGNYFDTDEDDDSNYSAISSTALVQTTVRQYDRSLCLLAPKISDLQNTERHITTYEKEFEHCGILGCGGSATVLLAKQRLTGNQYAIKVVKIKPFRRELILQEAKTHSLLDHSNVVRYFMAWEENNGFPETYFRVSTPQLNNYFDEEIEGTDGTEKLSSTYSTECSNPQQQNYKTNLSLPQPISYLCILMQHYPSGSLADWIVQRRNDINPIENFKFLRQLCHGLKYLHSKGIVHCDLKPSNILLERNGFEDDEPTTILKIADFGLSQYSREDHGHRQGFGTPLYASPEQRECHNSSVSYSSDVYSLGIIMYELFMIYNTQSERIYRLTNLRNYGIKKQHYDEENIYPYLAPMIKKMVCYHPSERISLKDLLEEINNVLLNL